jgi:hypothetical protein
MPTLPENSTANWRCRAVAVNDGVKLSSDYLPFGINVRRKLLKTNVCEHTKSDVR